MRKASFFILVLLAGLVLSVGPLLFGSSFHVAPVRIELSDQKPATTLQIGNEGDDPVTVQVAKVDSFKKQVDFRLVEDRKPVARPQTGRWNPPPRGAQARPSRGHRHGRRN